VTCDVTFLDGWFNAMYGMDAGAEPVPRKGVNPRTRISLNISFWEYHAPRGPWVWLLAGECTELCHG
jgi:hypothetical protein